MGASTKQKRRQTKKANSPRKHAPRKNAKAGTKMSALDAAARVLGEVSEPMNAKALIEAMAAKDYWVSPAGKTPAATLYAGILREIKAKDANARFQKVDRGKFELKS